jgi:hypothetical protein
LCHFTFSLGCTNWSAACGAVCSKVRERRALQAPAGQQCFHTADARRPPGHVELAKAHGGSVCQAAVLALCPSLAASPPASAAGAAGAVAYHHLLRCCTSAGFRFRRSLPLPPL